MDNSHIRFSRFLSFVLRHEPEHIGLTLDAQGWADIGTLLKKAKASGHDITRAEFDAIVANNDKQRFAISPCGRRVRASQGHSIVIDLKLAPQTPPEILYHGTATRFLDSILREGLTPGSRQHVHLSANWETAVKVGERHGKPVVLEVMATALHLEGVPFFLSDNGVWLVSQVPPKFLNRNGLSYQDNGY